MIRDLAKSDWLSILGIPEDAVPKALILRGTRNLRTQYERYRKCFTNVVEIGTPNGLVEDVLIGEVSGVRVGYASVYGGSMASEIVHMFGILGTPLVVQTGCCGALADQIGPGDLVLAEEAYCGDGASQYYKFDCKMVKAFPKPSELLLCNRVPDIPLHFGSVYTTAALFAEGKKEIEDWYSQGFAAVDMETAAVFAVAEHFGMERISILFAFDNPRRGEHLLLDEMHKAERRAFGNQRMMELAFKVSGAAVEVQTLP
jgi:uridine phosphorylase